MEDLLLLLLAIVEADEVPAILLESHFGLRDRLLRSSSVRDGPRDGEHLLRRGSPSAISVTGSSCLPDSEDDLCRPDTESLTVNSFVKTTWSTARYLLNSSWLGPSLECAVSPAVVLVLRLKCALQ